MPSSPGERALAGELVIVVISQAGAGFQQGKWPAPSRFISALFIYAMLSGVALFGPGPAKAAGGMGGLIALYMVVTPPKGETQSPLEGLFGWIAALESGGIRKAGDTSASATQKASPTGAAGGTIAGVPVAGLAPAAAVTGAVYGPVKSIVDTTKAAGGGIVGIGKGILNSTLNFLGLGS